MLVVLLAALVGLGGCASPRTLRSRIAELEQPRCQSTSSPLVTEWSASEKANLEALLGQGVVAVAYSGCAMRVLPRCRVPGSYVWQRTTPASDFIEISDENELYAKLPLGAASLEGDLRRTGHLSVHTVVSGLLRLDSPTGAELLEDESCAQATHVVEALSVGAFTLTTGGSASVGAGVGVTALGQAGGRVGGSEQLIRAAGEAPSCGAGTEQAPHPNCRSPLQVFLRPLPGRVAEEGPPGTVKVDFISAHANGRWDVYIDDEVACSTPCSRWVHPSRPIFLRARDSRFFAPPDEIQVPGLSEYAVEGPLQLRAHSTSQGQLATGITFSGLGGMGLMTGITLGIVGCASERSELCQAGLISLGAGALVTAGAVWLILDSAPKARVLPALEGSFGPGGGTRVHVGPGFIRGSFQ